MNRKLFVAVTVAVAFATAALANDNIRVAQNTSVSREQALETARKNGLVTLREIERDDGKWEIEGRDAQGRKIEIDVHGRTGEVIKLEID